MNIESQKKSLIHQIEHLEDAALLNAIEYLLKHQNEKLHLDADFSEAINLALIQSENNEVRSNDEVKADIYKRFNS